ncbi:acyl-CoA dehydrogenase family protein, partial [Paraburkholderia sp.]|uniref:acyl-CoA dehydrogenase family protein n=1 Tax=Paraburkholderia sp. TaxID=1926495 RepID=UPI003C79CCC5
DATFPRDVVNELGHMGLLGITTPTDLDGSGMGAIETAIVVEEVARGDGSLALTVASHNGLCTGHINLAGSPAQKEKYVRPLARGEKLGAWALTEPGSGSDAAGMLTTAVRQGDHWVLNGSKIFITQGTVGDTYVVLTSTNKEKGTKGITAFIVEKGVPGFEQRPLKDKLGMRSSDTAVLTFDQVKIPDAQRLGKEGEGFIDTLKILDRGRITIGALAVGLARGALEEARKYAMDRKQFGKPIAEFQAIQWKLADMATELEAARLLVHRAAWLCDQGKPFSKEASMGKLFASEAAMRATDEAVQIHGGYGYTSEFQVERYMRDAKLCTIGEGTSEVQRMVIARLLLKELS